MDVSNASASDSSARHAATEPASPATSFPSFSSLPRHISNRILTLACRSPHSSCSSIDADKRGKLELDAATTLSLARVSKPFNKVVTPILWTSIAIKRPSALVELAAAVEARPKLALHIKNLHLGGDEMWVSSEWPLDLEYGGPEKEELLCLKTTLSFDDMDRLPRWCMPHRAWGLMEAVAGMVEREKAVNEAIAYALRDIDVHPYKREYGASEKWIGLEHWGIRIHELQACLDLYLIKMRKIEDARGYNVPDWTAAKTLEPPPAGRYPRLIVTGFSSPTSLAAATKKLKNTADVFVVTRAQIWRHLTRRGSPMDEFDHPILWGRLGLHDHPFNENGEKMVQCFMTGPHWHLFKPDEEDEKRTASAKKERHPMQGEQVVIDALQLAPHYTFRGIPRTAHRIIGRALKLHNLSLTGTFETVLVMPLPTFETLKSLSLGPNMPAIDTSAHFSNRLMTLRSLENLRVCGPMLHPMECRQIAGEGNFMPKLKRVMWELIEPCKVGMDSGCHPTQYLGRGALLQGPPLFPPSANEEPLVPRLIEMRLHPAAWPQVFSWRTPRTNAEARHLFPAPLNEGALDLIREGEKRRPSWLASKFYVDQQGRVSPNRLVCTVSVAAGQGKQKLPLTSQDRQGMKMLLRQAREWWEECAELGERERPTWWEGDWLPGQSWGTPFVLESKAKR